LSYEDLAEREATALRTANEQRHAAGLPPIVLEDVDGAERAPSESGRAEAATPDGGKGSRRAGKLPG